MHQKIVFKCIKILYLNVPKIRIWLYQKFVFECIKICIKMHQNFLFECMKIYIWMHQKLVFRCIKNLYLEASEICPIDISM